jgi:hypothetical protein
MDFLARKNIYKWFTFHCSVDGIVQYGLSHHLGQVLGCVQLEQFSKDKTRPPITYHTDLKLLGGCNLARKMLGKRVVEIVNTIGVAGNLRSLLHLVCPKSVMVVDSIK